MSHHQSRVLGEVKFKDKVLKRTLMLGEGLNFSETKHDGERLLWNMYRFFSIGGDKPKVLSDLIKKIFIEGMRLVVVDERREGTDIILTLAGEVYNMHDLRNALSYLNDSGCEFFLVVDFKKPPNGLNLLVFSDKINNNVAGLNFDIVEREQRSFSSQREVLLLEDFIVGLPEYVKTILRISPPQGCSKFFSELSDFVSR